MATVVGKSLLKQITSRIGNVFKTTMETGKRFAKEARRARVSMKEQGMPLDKAMADTAKESALYKGTRRVFHTRQTHPSTWKAFKYMTSPVWGGPYVAAKAAMGMANFAVRNPVKTGLFLGSAHGVGKHVASIAENRTAHISRPGMKPNNLGTDGLTLSLSRMRHRG